LTVGLLIVDDDVKQYSMPFEAEAGLHPSLELIQDVVVAQKLRPQFSVNWLQDVVRLSTCHSAAGSSEICQYLQLISSAHFVAIDSLDSYLAELIV